jgi:leader peptidase (prepilin peptidase) / N-methyltransferase
LLGLIIGSFLNVLIYRTPVIMNQEWAAQCAELNNQAPSTEESINLFTPRSFCKHCGHTITALENIPVLSYLFLRGKCSQCKTPISLRYPAVEALAGLIGFVAFWRYGFTAEAGMVMVFLWTLLSLTLIDYDTQLLPDSMTLPLLWLGLIGSAMGWIKVPLPDAVWGAVAGYLALWCVYWLFKLVTGKEGMGYGDFKLLAALGAWMGWQQLPIIILLSSLVGAIVGVVLILAKQRGASQTIPFGPYLAGAGAIAWFYGTQISQYLF